MSGALQPNASNVSQDPAVRIVEQWLRSLTNSYESLSASLSRLKHAITNLDSNTEHSEKIKTTTLRWIMTMKKKKAIQSLGLNGLGDKLSPSSIEKLQQKCKTRLWSLLPG